MPNLEWNSQATDARWGRGIERFNLYYVDPSVKEWYAKNRFPEIITTDFLKSVPLKGIALLRDTAFLQQADQLRVENSADAMNRLAQMGLGKVGDVFTELNDNNRSTDYIVPIESGSGQIQVVVNTAFGIHWRISKDHPLAKEFPNLTITHKPDASEKPVLQHGNVWRRFTPYVGPDTLVEITALQNPDLGSLATDIRNFLIEVLALSDRKIQASSISLGYAEDDKNSALNISQKNHESIAFLLGNELGIKQFKIFQRNLDNPLSQQAAALEARIEKLHRFIEDK